MIEGSGPGSIPYLWLVDPDPGDPKTCGSGSATLLNGSSSPGKEVLVEERANIFELGVHQAVQGVVSPLRLNRHLEVGGQHGPALGQNLNHKTVLWIRDILDPDPGIRTSDQRIRLWILLFSSLTFGQDANKKIFLLLKVHLRPSDRT